MFALLADFFTLSRLGAAAVLVWLGAQGPQTLTAAIVTGVLAWTTDQLDGWAARRSSTPTKLAAADFAIDTTLYVGTLAYMALAGFLPAVPVLLFSALMAVGYILSRRKSVQVLFVRLIDLASGVIIFTHRPLIGVLLVAWLAMLTLIYRRRVAERLPRWLSELREMAGLHK